MSQRAPSLLHRLPIRWRLVMIITLPSLLMALVIAIALIQRDTNDYRQQALHSASTIATALTQDFVEVMVLDSPDAAANTLAKLQAFDTVHEATVVSRSGRTILNYTDEPNAPRPAPLPLRTRSKPYIGEDGVYVTEPIQYMGSTYGHVHFRMSNSSLEERIQLYYLFLALFLPITVFVAAGMALFFQRFFTSAVFQLQDVVRAVTSKQDLTVRLSNNETHEFGELYNGFNRMLDALQSASESLYREKERLHVTLASINDGVISTDANGRVEYVNPAACELTGWDENEITGHDVTHYLPLSSSDDVYPLPKLIDNCLNKGNTYDAQQEMVMTCRNGRRITVQVSIAPMRSRKQKLVGVVMVMRDITESHRMARELAWQATHDALTKLANRSEFEKRLHTVLEEDIPANGHMLLYMDLDQFKVVNDTCGHAAGDELLRQLSRLLKQQIRDSDILARLGGDEFGLLLENCPMTRAEQIAENLLSTVKNFRFNWDERHFAVGISIGIAPIYEGADSAESIMSAADTACYTAKERGRNQIFCYSETDQSVTTRQGEMAWVSRIQDALDNNYFQLFFQPIIHTQGKRDNISHCEILIRLQEPGCDIMAPGAFLSAAERYDLMPNIDRWVIHNTLDWLKKHPQILNRLESVAINLSGASINNSMFRRDLLQLLDANKDLASHLCFEITETVAVSNIHEASTFIDNIRARACKVSLDDFGAGMSSFAYLKNLSVDYLKIDGEFVRDMVNDPIHQAMVRSINEIGHLMGIKTIAEFVENAEILKVLQDLQVDYAQGYGIARPAPIKDMLELPPRTKGKVIHLS